MAALQWYAILALAIKLVVAENPGTLLSAFGLHVDTSALVQKIQANLHETFFQFRFKENFLCLDARWKTHKDRYSPHPQNCDKSRDTQNWTMWNMRLKVGSKSSLSAINGPIPCLDCHAETPDCDLVVIECKDDKLNQRFFVRIHARQLELTQRKIYFSIHSSQFPWRCISLYYSDYKKGYTIRLEECTGLDHQSFYIDNLDMSSEIQQINSRLFGCNDTKGLATDMMLMTNQTVIEANQTVLGF